MIWRQRQLLRFTAQATTSSPARVSQHDNGPVPGLPGLCADRWSWRGRSEHPRVRPQLMWAAGGTRRAWEWNMYSPSSHPEPPGADALRPDTGTLRTASAQPALPRGPSAGPLVPLPRSDGTPPARGLLTGTYEQRICPVNARLWTTLWARWGERGVLLWTPWDVPVDKAAGPGTSRVLAAKMLCTACGVRKVWATVGWWPR